MDGGSWAIPVRVIVSQERPMAAILPDLLANVAHSYQDK